MIKKIWSYFDDLPFSYKTSILIFIITGGMISIIILSQISIYTLKNDFDILFEKRTKPIIKLEKIKDTYKINIYDTLYDIQKNNISIKQSKEIILLGQQLINKNWDSYLKTSKDANFKKSYVTRKINELFGVTYHSSSQILQDSIISNINNKILELHRKIQRAVKLLEEGQSQETSELINEIYFEINSINIYITNLSNYDLNLAISERRETLKTFSTLTTV